MNKKILLLLLYSYCKKASRGLRDGGVEVERRGGNSERDRVGDNQGITEAFTNEMFQLELMRFFAARAHFEVLSHPMKARKWPDTKGRVERDEWIYSSSSVQCQVQGINAEQEQNVWLRTTSKHL